MIYLDNAATTQIDSAVLDEMMPFLKTSYGNPGSIHILGRECAEAVRKAREQVADFINAEPEQIIFTSSGSEANNLAITGLKDTMLCSKKTEIITSISEHDSVYRTVMSVCDDLQFGSHIIYPKKKSGVITAHDVLRMSLAYKACGLAALMFVNNETGVINPVSDIAEVCRARGIAYHMDCVQAASSQKIDVSKILCDSLSLSSHKIHGPKGVGALYLRDPSKYKPLIVGGKSQEKGLRAGTENVAGIVGFGKACELMKLRSYSFNPDCLFLKSLYDMSIKYGIPGNVFSVNGDRRFCAPNILSLRVRGVDSESLILTLEKIEDGVCISSGAACSNHESRPSRVLIGLGLSRDDARSSVRISFSKMNTRREISDAAEKIAACVSLLRDLA